ncbi:MAG: hypothetical protein AAF988_00035 [Pseudomonadota bacterium]
MVADVSLMMRMDPTAFQTTAEPNPETQVDLTQAYTGPAAPGSTPVSGMGEGMQKKLESFVAPRDAIILDQTAAVQANMPSSDSLIGGLMTVAQEFSDGLQELSVSVGIEPSSAPVVQEPQQAQIKGGQLGADYQTAWTPPVADFTMKPPTAV